MLSFKPSQSFAIERVHPRTKAAIDMRCTAAARVLFPRLNYVDYPAGILCCLDLTVKDSTKQPMHLVTVFDTSGSMASGRLRQLQLSQKPIYSCRQEEIDEIKAKYPVLENIFPLWRDGDKATMLEFNSRVATVLETTSVNSENQDHILARVNAMRADGSTYIERALNKMLDVVDANPEYATICALLTDGEDSDDLGAKLRRRAAELSFVKRMKALKGEVTFIGIGIGDGADTSTVSAICKQCPKNMCLYIDETKGNSGQIAGQIAAGMREFVHQNLHVRATLSFDPSKFKIVKSVADDDTAADKPVKRHCRCLSPSEGADAPSSEGANQAPSAGVLTQIIAVVIRNGDPLSLPILFPRIEPIASEGDAAIASDEHAVKLKIELLLDDEVLFEDECTLLQPSDAMDDSNDPDMLCVIPALRSIVARANEGVVQAINERNGSSQLALAAVEIAQGHIEALSRRIVDDDGPVLQEINTCKADLAALHLRIKDSHGRTAGLANIAGDACEAAQDNCRGGISLNRNSRYASESSRTSSHMTEEFTQIMHIHSSS